MNNGSARGSRNTGAGPYLGLTDDELRERRMEEEIALVLDEADDPHTAVGEIKRILKRFGFQAVGQILIQWPAAEPGQPRRARVRFQDRREETASETEVPREPSRMVRLPHINGTGKEQ